MINSCSSTQWIKDYGNSSKSRINILMLLPLQGEYSNFLVHRAMPYAMSFWAFSPPIT